MNNEQLSVEQKGEIVLYQPDESISLEVRLQDDTVWLMGTSLKDMGHSLCTVIKTGFTPEMILNLVSGRSAHSAEE